MDWTERIERQSPEVRAFLADVLDTFDVIGRFDRHPVKLRLTGTQNDGSRIDLGESWPARSRPARTGGPNP